MNKNENVAAAPMDERVFFYTFDLGLSAALVSTGFTLATIERANLQKSQFVFRRAESIDETIDDYWADRLEVKARAYFDALKMLKNRLYSE